MRSSRYAFHNQQFKLPRETSWRESMKRGERLCCQEVRLWHVGGANSGMSSLPGQAHSTLPRSRLLLAEVYTTLNREDRIRPVKAS
jgi:hypothetical protein